MHWTGPQKPASSPAQVDKGTGWDSLRASVTQNLAISTIGYPFVETDMIGGSLGSRRPPRTCWCGGRRPPPLMPLMYSSTSPVGAHDSITGK